MAVTRKAAPPRRTAPRSRSRLSGVATLAFDVGGTSIKAEALDPAGKPLADRLLVQTPYPLDPDKLLEIFKELAARSPSFDRVSVGFPGVVRQGVVISAPHFIREKGDENPVSPELKRAWDRFDLAGRTAEALGKPVRVGNDAEVQGMAVIKGKGLEVVITLGTGFGAAVFSNGRLSVDLELAHHPCHQGKTYNEYVGDRARRRIGNARWNRRVRRTVEIVRALLFFDHLYVGGGNAARVRVDVGDDVTLIDNSAGVLGGIKLWENPRGR
jgi:polyphosphate glucokinase